MYDLKTFNPITPSNRWTILTNKSLLSKKSSLKSKTVGKSKISGRNNQGRLTVYTKGGGHKKKFRIILDKLEALQGIVEAIEYDPNRTANIARVYSIKNKKHYYILASDKLRRGNWIDSSFLNPHIPFKIGNSYKLSELPLGVNVFNIPFPFSKSAAIRAAGCKAILVAKNNEFCRIKLSSGQFRLYPADTIVSLGSVSNIFHKQTVKGKAGRSRWLGRRPSVRGVAMNPVDHPHGGGEGKTSGGRPSVTPWGKVAKGQKTRNKNKKHKYLSL